MSSKTDRKSVRPWLAPGVALMQRLNMPIKLSTLAAILMIPLVVITFYQLETLRDEYVTAGTEMVGAEGVNLISDVITDLQHVRGESLLAGTPEFDKLLAESKQRLQKDMALVDAWVTAHPEIDMGGNWSTLAAELQTTLNATDAEAQFESRSALVGKLRKAMYRAAERSALVLDPYAEPYFLQDILTEHAIPWLEAVSRARAIGVMMQAAPTGARDGHAATLASLVDTIEARTEAIRDRFDAIRRSGAPDLPKGAQEALESTQLFTATVRKSITRGASPDLAEAAFKQATKTLEVARVLRNDAAARLVERLTSRMASARMRMMVVAALAGVGLLLVTYLILCFSVATLRSISALHRAITEGTKGNLATHVTVPGTDEMARISREFENMLNVLSTLVADVRSASSMVTHVGAQLVEDGHQLSQRTQSQAVSLEEAASNVGQVSDTVARNSEAAQEVSLMTKSLHAEAGNASELMDRTVHGMTGLQTTSERMREIIGTIDGIAFQTNLLALNAAVEAARAGEQGKGFAVVAAEVRNLARRSQSAAAEVRTLIAESSSRVMQTVQEIQEVNGLMTSLVAGISEIAMNVETMADGSAKQSIALSEVVQAVGDLDRVTVENSGLVDRTSHRSSRLMQRSRQLENAVTYIKLRQGTADEALALAQRAHALVQEVGFDRAFEVFHDKEGGFVDRDLYIFVFDRQGIYRVIGADRNRVGTSLAATPGVDAQQLLDDAWHRCDQGGGWVEYNIINPSTGDVRGKSSYVLPLDDQMLIGCGAYRSALTDDNNRIL